MRMLAFSHWGAQKSHRATPDTLDTRIDALIMDRCRSEHGQIRSPKHRCGSSKLNRRRVFDAGGASLEGSALHGVVFDRSARFQKRAGEARLPGSGRESPSDPDSEGVRFGAGNC